MQHEFQYTFGGKFSVFGYSDPGMDVNQSEPTNDTDYFINNVALFRQPDKQTNKQTNKYYRKSRLSDYFPAVLFAGLISFQFLKTDV